MLAPTCWRYRRSGSGAPNGNARPSCYWPRLTLPSSASKLSWRCFMMPSSSLRHDPTDPQTRIDKSPIRRVPANSIVVGRILKVHAAPVGTPWMWALAFGQHEDRTPTHGYAATREAAQWRVSPRAGGGSGVAHTATGEGPPVLRMDRGLRSRLR